MRVRSGLLLFATVAAVAVATALPGRASAGWTLRFSFVPQQVYQGLPAAVSVLVKPANAHCSLHVRYIDGSVQKGLGELRASSGRASWTWTTDYTAPAGAARVLVSCGSSGSLTHVFTVVGGTARSSKLRVDAQGFSQRPDAYDAGSTVSYGVVLGNRSTANDAQNVTVLVNFLDAGGRVLQTSTSHVTTIAAGATFDVGGSSPLPLQTPVDRLEVVVQTASFTPHRMRVPAVENVHVVASVFESDWVGEVDGDVVNDDPTSTLDSAQLSIVLFDATGKVIGGGTGFVFASLPPGTRSYFSASGGFSAVRFAQVSTVGVSVVPTYKTT